MKIDIRPRNVVTEVWFEHTPEQQRRIKDIDVWRSGIRTACYVPLVVIGMFTILYGLSGVHDIEAYFLNILMPMSIILGVMLMIYVHLGERIAEIVPNELVSKRTYDRLNYRLLNRMVVVSGRRRHLYEIVDKVSLKYHYVTVTIPFRMTDSYGNVSHREIDSYLLEQKNRRRARARRLKYVNRRRLL